MKPAPYVGKLSCLPFYINSRTQFWELTKCSLEVVHERRGRILPCSTATEILRRNSTVIESMKTRFWCFKTSSTCLAVNLSGIVVFKIWIWWKLWLFSWYGILMDTNIHVTVSWDMVSCALQIWKNDLKGPAASFFRQVDISKRFLSAFLPIHNKISVRLLENISLKIVCLFVRLTKFWLWVVSGKFSFNTDFYEFIEDAGRRLS